MSSSGGMETQRGPLRRLEVLAGGGELGTLMRELDWSRTPVGPVEAWPQSLQTAVSICLNSRFPIVIWWGPEFTMFYNDAYKPVLGRTKHPGWLGRSGKECWSEIWDVVGPMLESVLKTGEATWSQDLLLVLDRNLPCEETYFTFSYSPILDQFGGVGGIFCACTETTGRVLGERRLSALRDLAGRASEARSAVGACEAAAMTLAANTWSIPFSLTYLLNAEGTHADLAAFSNLQPGAPATIARIDLMHPDEEVYGWPLARAARSRQAVAVDDVQLRFGALPGGPWPEPTNSALILPLETPGSDQIAGFLVVGVSPRCVLDGEYRSFLTLAAGHVATAVGNARAYEEERKRAEALAELDRAKTTFFSNVSHEFRTPLTLMLGPAEDALADADEPLPPSQRDRIQVMQRNGLRLLKLVTTLLDFSRIEAGRLQASYAPTDLASLTRNLGSVFRSAIERAGLRFDVDCPPLPEPVYVDRDMWEKVVLNLLSNAFKFTFEGGISLSLAAADGMAELCVRDTGAGIGPSDLPRVFERFYRVRGASGRTYEGTGIGLALVQELVKLHGGSVKAESALARGSAFTVTIPFGRKHLPQERITSSPKPASPLAGGEAYVEEALRWLPDLKSQHLLDDEEQQGPKARILLADDNADMREYVGQLLRTRYQVEAVADGAAALAAATANPPDLILSDVMMPVLGGLDLLAGLRADPRTKTIPVILVSARAGESSKLEGLEAGADDYLIKPFSARELMARVAANLNLARMRDETRQRIGVILESVTDAFLAVDRDWVLTYMNTHAERFARVLGSGQVEGGLIGISLWEAYPAVLGTEFETRLRRAAAEKTAIHFEASYAENCWAQVNAYPSPDGGLAISFRDVSEQKRLEQHLRDTAKLESLGVLAGGIAHDFNNLLVGILGNASLAMEHLPGSHPAAPLVADVLNAGEAAANLTRQMLAYSGKGRFVIRLANLSELIGQNINLIHASIPKNVTLSLQLEANVPATRVDEAQIQQLIMNLVINAAEAFGERPGTVSILTFACDLARDDIEKMNIPAPVEAGRYVCLEVRDTGEGMDPDTQARIFDPFFTTKFMGRGLGLAAVLGIVRGHKGAIRLVSSPGVGTTFQLFFPVETGAAIQRSEKPPAEIPGQGTILVVDDEDLVLKTAKLSLERFGYQVLLAENGKEAVELFRQRSDEITLVLLDASMPVMNGYDAFEEMQRIRPGVRVVLSSGYSEAEAAKRFEGRGLTGFLQKPYTALELARKVRISLSTPRAGTAAPDS